MKTMQAELSNPKHSEYGVATIPFPIPDEEYDHVLELLEPLEIGDYVERDCQVDRLIGVPPILHMEVVDNASDENNENTRRKATVVPIKIEYV